MDRDIVSNSEEKWVRADLIMNH